MGTHANLYSLLGTGSYVLCFCLKNSAEHDKLASRSGPILFYSLLVNTVKPVYKGHSQKDRKLFFLDQFIS